MLRILTFAALACATLATAQASTYSVLHVFKKHGTDGRIPLSTLLLDRSGNLYGTTANGGTAEAGTVFRIAPDGTESVLYSFTGGTDGAAPVGSLIMDKDGNLYGTTCSGSDSSGVVFKLSPDGMQTVLHAFRNSPTDGGCPYFGALTRDKAGNLYGTTSEGGTATRGTVFKIAADGTESVLHSFAGGANDGAAPYAGLETDRQGDFYGTTASGGTFDKGTVFKMTPDGTTTILYSFKGGSDGSNPQSTLLRTRAGTLYGTTVAGGTADLGTVFKLKPNGHETVLYSFLGGADGARPYAGVVRDLAGNLYGTTFSGGTTACTAKVGCGTVYRLAPDGTETVLHAFAAGADGLLPYAGLVRDSAGTLYGDTYQCCRRSFDGTVFKLSP
jgi:uncharacterized repeat protein (TIGR03803 family)